MSLWAAERGIDGGAWRRGGVSGAGRRGGPKQNGGVWRRALGHIVAFAVTMKRHLRDERGLMELRDFSLQVEVAQAAAGRKWGEAHSGAGAALSQRPAKRKLGALADITPPKRKLCAVADVTPQPSSRRPSRLR